MTKSAHKAEYGKKRNRKVIFSCLVILVLALGSIGPMRAYFTDMETSENHFTVGKVECTANVSGGAITVTNDGSVSAYIRVFAEKERPDMTFSGTLNSEYWTEDGDYYYYNTAVEPEGTTDVLLIDVQIAKGTELIVYAEAIQAEGFDSAKQAFTLTPNEE